MYSSFFPMSFFTFEYKSLWQFLQFSTKIREYILEFEVKFEKPSNIE